MEREQATESPRKRLKTSGDAAQVDSQDGAIDFKFTIPRHMVDSQALKEAEVGISSFVSSDIQGFSGILKKRYEPF
jgi:tRNA pseudouridine13 synthase